MWLQSKAAKVSMTCSQSLLEQVGYLELSVVLKRLTCLALWVPASDLNVTLLVCVAVQSYGLMC